ncbi:hydroxyethylthiazole kinase [Sinanaerobacter chloroacetimidivorans]|uniref:Hydroxyethylthiazole kinase n=1 Tax=Sinanaerobacter chloroacetimidivorans TaxID=2818044 RepID=A0A8J8B074_9FIRM|nr:hydroxyethylthiazole kinase [Sinanaerobacter chloroacetimidivorans]MBR0596306.1 hydroxyethylthiazole kinase [Sinanaerobacter chloroacetimidivorans]
MLTQILKNVKENTPLVHCITNYVTVNDCANALLAWGGSPIMADDVNEVEEITTICSSLYINIGTLNERTIASMLKAGKKACELGHPIVLDPVGAGASSMRTKAAFDLLDQVGFTVIRGNISEIKTIASGAGSTKGVDADISDQVTEENLDATVAFAKKLSEKTKSIIVITGAIDIVADHQKSYIIRNGNALMSKITGTGCMLTALIAASAAANPERPLDAAAATVCSMGICGELAYDRIQKEGKGTSSYRTYLIDCLSQITEELFKEGAKIEIK